MMELTHLRLRKMPLCNWACLIFKGSGFYLTDYRSDAYKKAADADKKASSGGESTAKSESSSTAKTEPAKKCICSPMS